MSSLIICACGSPALLDGTCSERACGQHIGNCDCTPVDERLSCGMAILEGYTEEEWRAAYAKRPTPWKKLRKR